MPVRAETADRLCEHCNSPFNRKRWASREEDIKNFLRRRFCSNACQTARFKSERNARLVNPRSLALAIEAGSNTAKKLVERFDVSGVQAKELREKLEDMLARRLISVVGRKGKNEAVYEVAQSRIRALPMFVEGRGDRKDDCRLYEDCLNRYDAEHPNSDEDAHCSPGCGWYKPVPVSYWYEAATYRGRVSQSLSCEDHSIE